MDDIEIQTLDTLESSHFWYRARKVQLQDWAQNINLRGSLLDLGSATGGNTILMSTMGFEVTSFEYSDIGVEIQLQKGIQVVKGDARKLPFEDEKFDQVICLDVLEHIVEDYEVTSEVFRTLKPGGRALFSVPQDQKLWSAHDIAVNHVRRYSKSQLQELMRHSGFNILETWSSLVILYPILRITRKFSRGSDLVRLNKIVNMFLYSICTIERFLPISKIKGVTLWVEVKKI